MIHSLIAASTGVLAFILVGSMTADVVEDSQTKTGQRQEGLFFAGPHLIQKAISGIGLMIKGLILTLVGFSATAPEAEKILAIQELAIVVVVLAIILPSISLFLLSRYEITRSVHESNLDKLGYGNAEGDAKGENVKGNGMLAD